MMRSIGPHGIPQDGYEKLIEINFLVKLKRKIYKLDFWTRLDNFVSGYGLRLIQSLGWGWWIFGKSTHSNDYLHNSSYRQLDLDSRFLLLSPNRPRDHSHLHLMGFDSHHRIFVFPSRQTRWLFVRPIHMLGYIRINFMFHDLEAQLRCKRTFRSLLIKVSIFRTVFIIQFFFHTHKFVNKSCAERNI